MDIISKKGPIDFIRKFIHRIGLLGELGHQTIMFYTECMFGKVLVTP